MSTWLSLSMTSLPATRAGVMTMSAPCRCARTVGDTGSRETSTGPLARPIRINTRPNSSASASTSQMRRLRTDVSSMACGTDP